MKRWMIAAAVAVGAMAVPGTASAASCGDDGVSATNFLFDSQGYFWDFNQASATPDRNDSFSSFSDGGSNGPADTPPGPFANSDSYDSFGALFVGGTATSNMYFSADNDSCSAPRVGELDFPVVNMGGLSVQRRFFTGGPLPGVRILNLITNPTGAPVTTKVQVGDLESSDDDGDLGSDEDSAVRASSSGDLSASPADLWAVTSDNGGVGADPALAHIVDGQGAAVKANLFQLGPGTDAVPQDNLVWGWNVTIPAGQTVGLMSFEVQQTGSDLLSSSTHSANAAAIANQYENTPLANLTQGMSPTEVASVVNWQPSNEFSATTQGRRLLVSVKSPGSVSVVDARTLAAESKKKKKKRPAGLKPSSASGNPPTISVPVLLNKAAKAKLRKKGKVTVNAKITFTPSGGTKIAKTTTQQLQIKVKKKGKKK